MNGRWSKLYQSFFDSRVMMGNHTAALLFAYMFTHAEYKPRVNKWGVALKVGEFDSSVRWLSEKLGCNARTIMRSLDYLETNGCIAKSHAATSRAPAVYKVINYSKYQGLGGDKSTTHRGDRNTTRSATRSATTLRVSPKGDTEGVTAALEGAGGPPKDGGRYGPMKSVPLRAK